MMKNTILILAAVACTNLATAQAIQVTGGKATFSTGEQNALVTTIYQNSQDDVVDKWKDYLKDFKNEKVKFADDEMFGDNVVIKEWGTNPVDIYTRFEENKNDHSVKMKVAFDLGGSYLSVEQDAAKYALAEKMIKDFAVKTTKYPMEVKMKAAQKLLDNMNSDQKDLEKENKNLHNDIENYKNKISDAENDIKKNESNQQKKKTQIDTQKTAVERLKFEMEGVK